MLQRMNWCLQRLTRVTADVLRGGDAVGLNDQLAEPASTFVLTGQDIQNAGPELRKPTEPIEDWAFEDSGVEQACGGAVPERRGICGCLLWPARRVCRTRRAVTGAEVRRTNAGRGS